MNSLLPIIDLVITGNNDSNITVTIGNNGTAITNNIDAINDVKTHNNNISNR